MMCDEVGQFAHAYVDREFEDEDRIALERHLTECERCREVVAFQTLFKTHLRARLRRPEPPPTLRGDVIAALANADATGKGPRGPWLRRGLPGLVMAAAAAVVLVGVMQPKGVASPIYEDAVRAHEKNLPVEVGGSEENVAHWMAGKVAVPVRPFRSHYLKLVGGRLGHMQSRDAAQLSYSVIGHPVATTMSVIIFDPTGWNLDEGEPWSGTTRGYNVVVTLRRGVGYAFVSDLSQDELLRVVAASMN